MFKIGDKVRVIEASHGWGSVKRGDIGTIVSIEDEKFRVNFPGYMRWVALDTDLELVDPEAEATPESPKFKVGDRVRVPVNSSGLGFMLFHSDYDGVPQDKIRHGSTVFRQPEYDEVGAEIVDIYNQYVIVKVPTKSDYTILGWLAEDLTLVTEGVNKPVSARKFKVGDKVRILPSDENYGRTGEIGTIIGFRFPGWDVDMEDGEECLYFRDEELELVVEKEPTPKPTKFKVGDMVKIISWMDASGYEWSYTHTTLLGGIGTITADVEDIYILDDSREYAVNFTANMLELVKAAQEEVKQETKLTGVLTSGSLDSMVEALQEDKTMGDNILGTDSNVGLLVERLGNGRVKKFVKAGFLNKDLEVSQKFITLYHTVQFLEMLEPSNRKGVTVTSILERMEDEADQIIEEQTAREAKLRFTREV